MILLNMNNKDKKLLINHIKIDRRSTCMQLFMISWRKMRRIFFRNLSKTTEIFAKNKEMVASRIYRMIFSRIFRFLPLPLARTGRLLVQPIRVTVHFRLPRELFRSLATICRQGVGCSGLGKTHWGKTPFTYIYIGFLHQLYNPNHPYHSFGNWCKLNEENIFIMKIIMQVKSTVFSSLVKIYIHIYIIILNLNA